MGIEGEYRLIDGTDVVAAAAAVVIDVVDASPDMSGSQQLHLMINS